MAKSIQNYRKSVLDNTIGQQESQRKRLQTIPILILTVIVLFSVSVWQDSSARLASIDTSLTEKAKICFVEFTQKKCDGLNPIGECRTLYDCAQQKDRQVSSKIGEYTKVIFDEILADFSFPTVVIGLLLLLQVSQTLKKGRPDKEQE